MSFADDLQRFVVTAEGRAADVFNRAADLAFESVVVGSAITASPGQPVDTGNLRSSWQARVLGPLEREISTNAAYAAAVEDGVGSKGQPVVYGPGGHGRSAVGGSHSVKQTRLGWQRILDTAAAR